MSERLDLDDALGLLASRHRRGLLVTLLAHNPQGETDARIDANATLADEEMEELHIEMIHKHLPKLERADVVEWDRERHEVSKGPLFDELRPVLELLDDNSKKLPDGWV